MSQRQKKKAIVCHYFARGICIRGQACEYLHSAAPPATDPARRGIPPQTPRDDPCPAPQNHASDNKGPSAAPEAALSENEAVVRELMGATVRFGAGAEVVSVSLASDFSAVRLLNIPEGSSAASVTGMLLNLDVRLLPHRTSVRIRDGDGHGHGGAARSADVTVEDPGFAKDVWDRVSAYKVAHGYGGGGGPSAADFVEKIAPWIPSRTRFCGANARRVRLAWRSPTRRATLLFDSLATAEDASRLFALGVSSVLGRLVVATALVHPRWGVVLEMDKVPARAAEADVVRDMPPEYRPRKVVMGGWDYFQDEASHLGAFERRLSRVGPLTSGVVVESMAGGETVATATFLDEGDARRAVRMCDGTALPFNPRGRLRATLVFTAIFVIPALMYEQLVASGLGYLKRNYPDVKLQKHVSSGGARVKLESENRLALAHAKWEIEESLDEMLPCRHDDKDAPDQPGPPTDPTATDESSAPCPVCLDDATDPTQAGCGHVYCRECLIQLFEASAKATQDGRIKCIGGHEGSCQAPFRLSELKNRLPRQAYEEVLASALESHVRRNPHKLKMCPTPGCTQLYRPAAVADGDDKNNDGGDSKTPDKGSPRTTTRCPDCLVVVCRVCHVPHDEDVSCGQAEDLANSQLKKALGIKDCPRCRTSIERTEGCNHIACGGCGTHICWVCMAHYGTGAECYDHMTLAHLGAFAGVPGVDVYGEPMRR
ncbi:hypothetical protein EsH8_VII_000905 [Colletotrichum jinshuiense]